MSAFGGNWVVTATQLHRHDIYPFIETELESAVFSSKA